MSLTLDPLLDAFDLLADAALLGHGFLLRALLLCASFVAIGAALSLGGAAIRHLTLLRAELLSTVHIDRLNNLGLVDILGLGRFFLGWPAGELLLQGSPLLGILFTLLQSSLAVGRDEPFLFRTAYARDGVGLLSALGRALTSLRKVFLAQG